LSDSLSEHGYEVVAASDSDEAWTLLQQDDSLSLAIVDRDIPGIGSMELCRRVRRWNKERYVYVLMLTARSGTPEMVESMHAGADDYIEKRCAFEELHARLRAAERILALQAQLRIEATHDVLTGTLNRRAILDVLEKEAARATRHSTPLGILMLDLDHFKAVNDRHGHMVGDAVLREISKRMTEPLRPYDALGRYGGEEFLIVLPQCDLAQTVEIAERIRLCVARVPLQAGSDSISATVSVGASAMDREPIGTTDLIERADTALYAAKRSGRNRVRAQGEGPAYHTRPVSSGGLVAAGLQTNSKPLE
jgi:diguanylate cyclase (GGDEF)-like protein